MLSMKQKTKPYLLHPTHIDQQFTLSSSLALEKVVFLSELDT